MKILFVCNVKNPSCNGVVNALINEVKTLSSEELYLLNLGTSFECKGFKKCFDHYNVENVLMEIGNIDLVVFEEVYKFEYIKLYKFFLKNRIPYLVIPHGSLVLKAQQNKKIFKTICNILLFNRFIKNAEAIQYLNIYEKEYSNFKIKKSIIIPNSIDMPIKKKKNVSKKSFVYIGRYSIFVKGLDLMLDSFIEIKDWCRNNNVTLSLYGRNTESNEMKQLTDIVSINHCEDFIKINPPILGIEKEKVLLDSYAFIQTSRHEGQPMGILEALSYGIPCIVTDGTNFAKYCNDNNCGIGVSFEKSQIIKGIKKLVQDKQKYQEYCKKAINSVKKDFSIEEISKHTINEYSKLIKK